MLYNVEWIQCLDEDRICFLPGSMLSMLTRYTFVGCSNKSLTMWEVRSSNPSLRIRRVTITSIVAAFFLRPIISWIELSGVDEEARQAGRRLGWRWRRSERGFDEENKLRDGVRSVWELEPWVRVVVVVVVDIIINSAIVMQRLDGVEVNGVLSNIYIYISLSICIWPLGNSPFETTETTKNMCKQVKHVRRTFFGHMSDFSM